MADTIWTEHGPNAWESMQGMYLLHVEVWETPNGLCEWAGEWNIHDTHNGGSIVARGSVKYSFGIETMIKAVAEAALRSLSPAYGG